MITIKNEMVKSYYQSADDVVYEAVELLIKQKINDSIQRGLNDVETGNFQTLTGNIDKITDSIVNQALKK